MCSILLLRESMHISLSISFDFAPDFDLNKRVQISSQISLIASHPVGVLINRGSCDDEDLLSLTLGVVDRGLSMNGLDLTFFTMTWLARLTIGQVERKFIDR